MKESDILKNLSCRRCGVTTLLTVMEEEYDWEISCAQCGELWWIDKGDNYNVIGDELKYKSSPHIKEKGKQLHDD